MSAKAVAYNGIAALIEEYVATKYNTKRHTKLNEEGTDLLNGIEVKYSSTHHFIKNAKIASKLSIDGLKNKMKATKIVAIVYDDINNEWVAAETKTTGDVHQCGSNVVVIGSMEGICGSTAEIGRAHV